MSHETAGLCDMDERMMIERKWGYRVLAGRKRRRERKRRGWRSWQAWMGAKGSAEPPGISILCIVDGLEAAEFSRCAYIT